MTEMTTALTRVEQSAGVVPVADIPLAEADLRMIVAWVASKQGSKHTQRAFRTEAQRWLAWSVWVKAQRGCTTWLDKADSLDAAAYATFLQGQGTPRFPAFALRAAGLTAQPFRALPLQKASAQRAISVLKTMYADMMHMFVEDGVAITRNPFARYRLTDMAKDRDPRGKALMSNERHYVNQALETMSHKNSAKYHQCRWIWNALLWAALRRSELAALTAGDIIYVEEERQMVWKLRVHGKGDKTKAIPLAEEFMREFRIYREHHGLSPLPTFDRGGRPEQTPLVLPLRGEPRNVSPDTIYRAIKDLFRAAAAEAEHAGDLGAQGRLLKLAAHSARHTCITLIVDATGDITLGQDIARHASITTTREYKQTSSNRLLKALRDVARQESTTE